MNKYIISLFATTILVSSLNADNKKVNSLDEYLKSIEISGDLRLGYLSYDYNNEKALGEKNSYETAIGGVVRFNFPIYKDNISMTLSPYFSKSFSELSNDNLLSDYKTFASIDSDFMFLGEASLNLSYEDISFVLGRQIINTPLMGDDDMRLTPQTFQGAMLNYKVNDFSFYVGYFDKWQGYDAGLLSVENKNFNEFQKMGTKDSSGTALFGTEFKKELSFSNIFSRAYYYDIDKYSKVFYLDTNFNNQINNDLSTDISFQYSNQSEDRNSGVDGFLYGTMLSLTYKDLYVAAAYTKSSLDKEKSLFTGFGGEFFYTAMNEWSMGNLSSGYDEDALGLYTSYDITNKLNFSFYTTTYETDVDEVKENDYMISYSFNDNLNIEAMYFDINDEKDSDNSYDIFLSRLIYKF
ncbi:OprD family outer membrane porin [Malaciobacter marinus]|uniref:OprD family outer membrane porin n=1 Tax=Malaciobacter marinus TaxID=505249 RepID=UPI003AFFFA1B